jgi:EXPERA (EXPanded EBP superfamily)
MATSQLAPAEPATGTAPSAPRRPIPLARRRRDLLFVAFFLLNLGFITYIVDVEQLVIADPVHFTYPLWPPAPLVDLVHWYGRTFDPLLLARPVWWKMTIWIDALGFGPFYAIAIYAYLRGREWIRVPTLLWAGVMLTNITIILGEEFAGPHATPQPLVVFLANLPWLLVPLGAIARMAPAEHPFSEP